MYRINLPIERIIKLYERGYSIPRLAKKYYVSYYAMWTRLNDAGVIRQRPRKTIPRLEMKQQLITAGMTYQEVADINAVSRRTIIRKAKKAQIKSQIGKNAKLNRYVVIGVQYMKSNKVKQKVIAEAFKISERSVVNATKINVQDYIDSLGKKVHRWNPDNN